MKKLLLALLLLTTATSCTKVYIEEDSIEEIEAQIESLKWYDIEGKYTQLINGQWDTTLINFTSDWKYMHGERYIAAYGYKFPTTTLYWTEDQGNENTSDEFISAWNCEGNILTLSYPNGQIYGVYKKADYIYSAQKASANNFCN